VSLRLWALAVLLTGGLAWPTLGFAQVPPGASVLVLPFDNPKQEPRLTWMREGAAVVLTDLLAASGDHRYEEIATMLAIPIGTVKWRISEARRLTRAKLERLGHGAPR